MDFTLYIWRQKLNQEGAFKSYEIKDIDPDASFLEMLDLLNATLVKKGEEPVAFEHDCREGICGACSLTINGRPHGPKKLTTTCQLKMRNFKDGEVIYVEPWRARAFPVLKDLICDRSAFDRIQQAGGYVSVNTGAAPDAHSLLVDKDNADEAFEAAACIGCGACVAACPNGSAMLFTAARISQFSLLPQGQPERAARAENMVQQMDDELFGSCTNHGECQEACPKAISIKYIALTYREFFKASVAKLWSTRGKMRAQ